jgi:hypothetical protein
LGIGIGGYGVWGIAQKTAKSTILWMFTSEARVNIELIGAYFKV